MFKRLRNKVYEDRLGKFGSDILPFSKLCKIFGWFPAINSSDGTERNISCRIFDFWSLLAHVIRIFCVCYRTVYTQVELRNVDSVTRTLQIQNAIVYLSMEMVFILTGKYLSDCLRLFNNFDCHAKTLQTKCKLMKPKYSKYIWLALEIFVIASTFVWIIFCLSQEFNGKISPSRMVYAFVMISGMSTNTLILIYLSCEINYRSTLLENSLRKIFSEIIVSRSDAVLIKLHIDKYRNLHNMLWSIIKSLRNFTKFIVYVTYCWIFAGLLLWFWYFYNGGTIASCRVMIVIHKCLLLLVINSYSIRTKRTVSTLFIYLFEVFIFFLYK